MKGFVITLLVLRMKIYLVIYNRGDLQPMVAMIREIKIYLVK